MFWVKAGPAEVCTSCGKSVRDQVVASSRNLRTCKDCMMEASPQDVIEWFLAGNEETDPALLADLIVKELFDYNMVLSRKEQICTYCYGTGHTGPIVSKKTCDKCKGVGHHVCEICGGYGHTSSGSICYACRDNR